MLSKRAGTPQRHGGPVCHSEKVTRKPSTSSASETSKTSRKGPSPSQGEASKSGADASLGVSADSPYVYYDVGAQRWKVHSHRGLLGRRGGCVCRTKTTTTTWLSGPSSSEAAATASRAGLATAPVLACRPTETGLGAPAMTAEAQVRRVYAGREPAISAHSVRSAAIPWQDPRDERTEWA